MGPRVFVTLGVAGALAFGCDAGLSNNTQTGSQGTGAATTGGAGGTGGMGGVAGGGGQMETTSSNSSSSSSGSGGTGAGPAGCTTDANCANDPAGSYCELSTGNCVGCLPGAATCAQGKYCDPMTKQCANGCLTNADCSGINPNCNVSTHTCVECITDTNCPQGSICGSNSCFPGCSGQQPCVPGFSCCTSSCYDLAIDVNNCGSCNHACPAVPNAAATCFDGNCSMGACLDAFADCDQDSMNGCEWNILQDGPCACTPGMTKPCYQGAPGTQGVGPCKSGTQTCNANGTSWGACMGQVLPKSEMCANSIDEDCNGTVDDSVDYDGDGWTMCGGDCCDTVLQGCSNPRFVNPGAFEVVGNGINDDCDATTSDTEPEAACSTAAKFTGLTAIDVAKSMEICKVTTANPPLAQKKWGIITSALLQANGSAPSAAQLSAMQDKQMAVLVNYGTGGIVPKKGPTMAGLSSGLMRDENDPGYSGSPDTNNQSTSTPPAAYLAAHAGALPSSAGCSGNCPAGSGAYDSTNVRLFIRVPTNAQSLSYQFKFISYEYWTYSCTIYNDFYLALLQSGAMGIPADKNISFDGSNNPVSVNNGFFDVCVQKGCYTCPAGYAELAGTGMQMFNNGGGTKWLTTEAPVVPGETIQLDFALFDVSDNALDSVTLLDNFQWGLSTAVVNTHD